MLGRHHLLLSFFSLAVLLVPYFSDYTLFVILALIGAAIGSLIPDADSPDAAIFHSHIRVKGDVGKLINNFVAPLFPVFGHVTKYAIYKPAVFIFGNTILKKYNIAQEHRGFLHSFIGIITAGLFTALYLIILLLFLKMLNVIYLIVFMLAYLFGAFMHLLEDSATVTGIQFNYPFSKLRLRGKFITRPDHPSMNYPDGFSGVLIAATVAIFFALELKYLNIPVWMLTVFTVLCLVVIWVLFLVLFAKVEFTMEERPHYHHVKSFF